MKSKTVALSQSDIYLFKNDRLNLAKAKTRHGSRLGSKTPIDNEFHF